MKKVFWCITVLILGLASWIYYVANSNPYVIITEFGSNGEIVNTLITNDYCLRGDLIEVRPLDSKDVYLLKGSVQISEVSEENNKKNN